MKKILSILIIFSFSLMGTALFAQDVKTQKKEEAKPAQVVEASCGQCQFGLKGKGCDLAVRIDGKAYYVEGTSMDKHGDAHAKNGMCNAIRKAEVTGEVKNDKFVATAFKLLPSPEEKK